MKLVGTVPSFTDDYSSILEKSAFCAFFFFEEVSGNVIVCGRDMPD